MHGVRPIEAPNDDTVIVNACKAAPYKLATDVKRRDKFWIKPQPYSLEHMLANDPLVDKFIGGTIYQAFLSALSYQDPTSRWKLLLRHFSRRPSPYRIASVSY